MGNTFVQKPLIPKGEVDPLLLQQSTDIFKQSVIEIPKKPEAFSKEYKLGEQIGITINGKFMEATHYPSKEKRVIRIINNKDMSIKELKGLVLFTRIQFKFDHPNLVKAIDLFKEKKNVCIVYEHVEGCNLFDHIQNTPNFSESEAAKIVSQLLSALIYLHKNHLVLRDLKPEVIRFDKITKKIKIFGFRLCKVFIPGENMTTCHGTPFYMAPETLKESYNEKVDVWACGIIFFMMLSGQPPFVGKSDEEIFTNILSQDVDFDHPFFECISSETKEFIKILLNKNPKERPTAFQALANNYFKTKLSETPIPKEAKKRLTELNTTSDLIVKLLELWAFHKSKHNLCEILTKSVENYTKDNSSTITKDSILSFIDNPDFEIDRRETEFVLNKISTPEQSEINAKDFISELFDYRLYLIESDIDKSFKELDRDKNGWISKDTLRNSVENRNGNSEIEGFLYEFNSRHKEETMITLNMLKQMILDICSENNDQFD